MAVFGFPLIRCRRCRGMFGPVGIEMGEGMAARKALVQSEISESCPQHRYGDWNVPRYSGPRPPGPEEE